MDALGRMKEAVANEKILQKKAGKKFFNQYYQSILSKI